MDIAPGTLLSRFRVEQKLGRGSCGVVYLATDTLLGEKVAIKVLHDHLAENYEVRERFKREIVLTRRVSHPGVCRLHDVHEMNGNTFITMQYVDGQTLSELVQKEVRLSPKRTLEILRSLAPPLQAAHDAGVVHRDFKPGNIMVKDDGTACLLDFGMATADDVARITNVGRTVGSLRFIAPEVWEGNPATAVADIYALGVVLFACLAGRLPSDATTPAEAFEAQKRPPPSLLPHNPEVSPSVDALVRKAMARKPEDRFQSVSDVLQAFEEAVSYDEPTTAMSADVDIPTTPISPPQKWQQKSQPKPPTRSAIAPIERSRRNTIMAVYAVGAVLTAIAVAWILWPTTAPTPIAPAPVAPPPVVVAPVPPPKAVEPQTPPPPPVQAPAPVEAVPPVVAPPAPDTPYTAAQGNLTGVMKKRGLLAGDVPRADALLNKAKALDAKGKSTEAASLVDKARGMMNRQSIDRSFITAKQKRLRQASQRATQQTKVNALERQAERLVTQQNYAAANEKLNEAFALLK